MSQGKQMYYHYLRENIRNMNPRFKELAVEAGAYKEDGTVLTGPMDVAKFAELIVQECIQVCNQEWYDLNNSSKEDLDDRGIAILVGQKAGVLKSQLRIKKHFGVE